MGEPRRAGGGVSIEGVRSRGTHDETLICLMILTAIVKSGCHTGAVVTCTYSNFYGFWGSGFKVGGLRFGV